MTTEVNQVLGLSSDTFSAEDSMKSPILTSAETFIDQSSSSLSTRTLNKFTLISIIGSALLTGLSLAMIIPVLPKLLLIAVNENSSHAAWITGTVSFAGSCVEIFSNPILGRASDRIGRKPILMLSVLGLLVELLLIGCFYNSVAVYVAARMIASLTGVFFVTLNTIYADIAAGTGEEAYTYGVSGASFGVCFVIGPILGGKLERVHTALAVFASCTLLTLNLFYITFFVPETNTHSIDPDLHNSSDSFIRRISKVSPSVSEINPIPSAAKLLQNPVLKWLALSFMFDGLAGSGLQSIFFLFANERFGWKSDEVGQFFSVVGLGLLISQGVITPYFVPLVGDRLIILLGYFCESIHFLIYAFATTPRILYLGLGVGFLGFCATPAFKGVVSRQVDPSEQGALQGSLASLQTLARPIAPLISNAVFALFSSKNNGISSFYYFPGAPMIVLAGFAFIAFFVAIKALSNPKLK